MASINSGRFRLFLMLLILSTLLQAVVATQENNNDFGKERDMTKEDIRHINVGPNAISQLEGYWADQGISAIMASIADEKLAKLAPAYKREHQKCARKAKSVERHAKCVSMVLKWHDAKQEQIAKHGPTKTFDDIKASLQNRTIRKHKSPTHRLRHGLVLDHHKREYLKQYKRKPKPKFAHMPVDPTWKYPDELPKKTTKYAHRKSYKISSTTAFKPDSGFKVQTKASFWKKTSPRKPRKPKSNNILHRRKHKDSWKTNKREYFGDGTSENWIGAFRVRAKRDIMDRMFARLNKDELRESKNYPHKVVSKSQYSLPDVRKNSENPDLLGMIMKKLSNTLQLLKNKPIDNRTWMDRVKEIRHIGERLRNKKQYREVMSDRMKMIQDAAKSINMDVDLGLLGLWDEVDNATDAEEARLRSIGFGEDEETIMEGVKKKELEIISRAPVQLMREGLRIVMQLAGKDTKDFDKKNIRFFSPKVFEVVPEKENKDTLNVLSPRFFSMHNQSGDVVEKVLSAPNSFGFNSLNGGDQQNFLNFILEASGVSDIVEKMKKMEKAEDRLSAIGLDTRMFGDPEMAEKLIKNMEVPKPPEEEDGLTEFDEEEGRQFFKELQKEVDETDEDADGSGEGSGEEDDDSEEEEASKTAPVMDNSDFASNCTDTGWDDIEPSVYQKHCGMANRTEYKRRHRYKIQGPNGTSLYMTQGKIKKLYGRETLLKVLLFERFHKSITKSQMEDFKQSGISMLTKRQLALIYGKGSPFANETALAALKNMTKVQVMSGVEDIVHKMATLPPKDYNFEVKNISISEKQQYTQPPNDDFVPVGRAHNEPEHRRTKRWGIIGTPIAYTPVVLDPALASQPFILSPIIFSTIVLSPNIFGALVLCPWAFVPIIASPKLLGPIILSTPLWTPIILTPLALDPIVLSPGVGVPLILSPFLMTPFIVSPQVMTPLVLSPLCLSPIILTPHVLTPLVLSPFVLTPIILSPGYVGGLFLSPSAFSPGVLSTGAIFTAFLSPSVFS